MASNSRGIFERPKKSGTWWIMRESDKVAGGGVVSDMADPFLDVLDFYSLGANKRSRTIATADRTDK